MLDKPLEWQLNYANPNEGKPPYELVRILAVAFDHYLAEVKAGRRVIQLRRDHDLTPAGLLASTADNSLRVWRNGDLLNFRLRPEKKAGRRVIRFVRSNPAYRGASVGAWSELCFVTPVDGRRGATVAKARLEEISLTPHPADPGCCVFVS